MKENTVRDYEIEALKLKSLLTVTLQEAEAHKKLFDDDDSDLYERIEIIPN